MISALSEMSNAAVMDRPLTLLAVHAHPDDEASSTGAVLARYAAEGIRTVLVTCTNGDQGDGPGGIKPDSPDHDPQAVSATRMAELEAWWRFQGELLTTPQAA